MAIPEGDGDPRYHTQNMQNRLNETIDHLRRVRDLG